MQGTILLNHNENTKQVEEEEKTKFLHGLLEQMGVPIEEIWSGNEPLSINQKLQLKKLLTSFGIQIIDQDDMTIYVEGEIAGVWERPTYKLKRDLSQIDRRKQLYLEMTIKCSSVFDSE